MHTTAAASSPPLPTVPRTAKVVPIYGQGPPPDPPQPLSPRRRGGGDEGVDGVNGISSREAEERAVRIARRQALAVRIRSGGTGGQRFWKAAGVTEAEEKEGPGSGEGDAKALLVNLDTRPLRHPTTRQVLRLPARKRLLAHALAAEWDQLASVRQAVMQGHRVPLMSLVCRAVDLERERAHLAAGGGPPGLAPMRATLVDDLLRYLDTDSLLCWAPVDAEDAGADADTARDDRRPGLRQMQERTCAPMLAHLTARVWPGVVLEPVLGAPGQANALFPRPHPPETRAAVRAWLERLDGWDLAGVERATLAGKSLVLAARLVAAWSPTAGGADSPAGQDSFSVDDAFAAANMETAFQTAQWGEVDDTHDVEQADMRRHFGSVILLVS